MAKSTTKKKSNHKRQAWAAVFFALAVLLFFAIISFDVNDPVHLDTENNAIPIANWLGPLGALVAYYLMQWTLGYPIIILPVLLFQMALYQIKGQPLSGVRRTALYLLIWGILFSIILAMPEALNKQGLVTEYYPSGLIGGWIAAKMVLFLGRFGSLLTISLLSLIILTATIRIEWNRLLSGFGSFFENLRGAVSNVLIKLQSGLKERRRLRVETKRIKIKEAFARREESHRDHPAPEIEIDERPAVRKPLPPEPEVGGTEPAPPPRSLMDDFLGEEPRAEEESSPVQGELDFEVREESRDEQLDYDRLVKESIARYQFPSIDLLHDPVQQDATVTREELKANADLLEMKLLDFGVKAKVIRVTAGPVITLYELQPAPGVKVSSIVTLANDLALALEARGIRIIAPIPGKAAVGIEIPNRNPQIVYLKPLIRSDKFSQSGFELPLAIGKTINGESYIADLTKMPHLLIAGATGSGKSVGINTIIVSLLYAVNPGKVKFVMIDPKKLELSLYAELRDHYLLWRPDLDEEVITKPNNAVSLLNSVVLEMERRYNQLAELGVRSIVDYNRRVDEGGARVRQLQAQQLPYIIVIVDELADLMLVAAKEVETPITRLAQMARAVGIHLILATQRPSVDVITGVIKANFPARIGYQVASKVDSRTVMDMNGAEQLLGNGDMLFLPPGQPKPIRLQNPFISTDEVESVISHIKNQAKLPYYSLPQPKSSGTSAGAWDYGDSRDSLYEDARAIVVQHQQGSISFLQRRLKIGYARAARLMDELEEDGVVGAADGSKPREVLITLQELQNL